MYLGRGFDRAEVTSIPLGTLYQAHVLQYRRVLLHDQNEITKHAQVGRHLICETALLLVRSKEHVRNVLEIAKLSVSVRLGEKINGEVLLARLVIGGSARNSVDFKVRAILGIVSPASKQAAQASQNNISPQGTKRQKQTRCRQERNYAKRSRRAF